MIVLDLPGAVVQFRDEDGVRLRDAAAARAGRSSAARDLSLLLDRALRGDRIALRRGELQPLIAIASESGLSDVAQRLDDAVANQT